MTWFADWFSVAASIALFTVFGFFFIKPVGKRDWRGLGIYEAFIVSLFTEMFGIPITIYALSSFFGLPLATDPSQGHLLAALLALAGVWDLQTGVTVVMTTSILIIAFGGYLVVEGWSRVHGSADQLATTGVYGVVRHPQYLGLIIATGAFLIQWPTIVTVAMWPILVYAYYHQAKKEERQMEEKFGETYRQYKQRIPMFIPRFRRGA